MIFSLNFVLVKAILLSISLSKFSLVNASAFDQNLYNEVLNTEECENQISFILGGDGSRLKTKFTDAGMRTPRGILLNNLRDMGNYHQCLDITHTEQRMSIEGKYCVVNVPVVKDSEVLSAIGPEFPWTDQSWTRNADSDIFDPDTFEMLLQYDLGKKNIKYLIGSQDDSKKLQRNLSTDLTFELGICIPKVCSVQQVLNILNHSSSYSAESISEDFCRLPNDKPWVSADYVAIAIFSFIGLITVLSTGYDIWHTLISKNSNDKPNKIYMICSIYTNTTKLFTFHSNKNALHCLEGVRSLAMLWIICIHIYSLQTSFLTANPLDVLKFYTSISSVWITNAAITVDTFFMMTGLLLVYTVTPKFSRVGFLKNLHYFYLNRYLRMFAPLATVVLLQASFLNHISDGPYWQTVAKSTEDCRQYWWSTLLYVHNYVSFGYLCVGTSWYLAVDMQLYVLSPIVLIWVVGSSKRSAWTALIGSLVAILIASTVYNFIMKFPSTSFSLSRSADLGFFTQYYYMNTLTRGAPFFVGMAVGYGLHLCKGRSIRLSKFLVAALWVLSLAATTSVVIVHYFILQPDWDNQVVDSILNSFMRPVWALGVSWVVFACVHGYGGPVNWFLSLHIFKVLGRLSYIMYIVHMPIMYVTYATALSPIYFSDEFAFYQTMTNLNLTIVGSVLIAVLIDIPFSSATGMLLAQKNKGDTRRSNAVGPSDVENSRKPKPSELTS